MALTKALGAAVFCGLIWELVRIGIGRTKKIHPGLLANFGVLLIREERKSYESGNVMCLLSYFFARTVILSHTNQTNKEVKKKNNKRRGG